MSTSPIRPTDDAARDLARGLIAGARFAALAVRGPDGAPGISRIALATAPDGAPISLMSDLSHHSKALRADPVCALLVGEPGDKGDPLTHPRLSLSARAEFIEHADPAYAPMARHFLTQRPKAKLYIGFTDFAFVRFDVTGADLNGGFGKAFRLSGTDLTPQGR